MGDDELAELRRRRVEQLQRQSLDQQALDEELRRQKQVEAQIHHVLLQILEPEARERLANIKLTKPDFARSIEQQLVALAQSGRLKQKITDAQLKDLLRQLIPGKKDWNIRRA
ncbi:MAG TPA: DNA-binding protein [Methanomicrobiales archaeon]|jgi:programmed cell death protein 5|nr:DNA-binding protein [Methanomicrobiales archaeon]